MEDIEDCCNCDADSHIIIHETIEVGRNEKCPCGSGKKHKKCCLGDVLPIEQVLKVSPEGR